MARSHYGLALIERDLGNFDNARKHIIEAISIADSLRNRITSEEIKSVYFAAVKKYYDFYIDLLMQAHKAQPEKQYDRVALEMSERARSRNLVDLLKISGIDIRKGGDKELLAKEKELRAIFAERAAFHSRLMIGRPKPEDAEKAQRDVNEAAEALAKVESDIRRNSPRYAELTQPSALSVKQLQAMLDSGTVVLQYFLGERKSYGWVISPETVYSFELPPRSDIESQARAVYASVTARNIRDEGTAQRAARLKKADAELAFRSAKLAETLLAPAESYIKNKRLAIVPDGALNYISFAALPLPAQTSSGASGTLGLTNEIVVLPSVSSLAQLRDGRPGRKSASKAVAVFADPVFHEGDARTARNSGQSKQKAYDQNTVALRDLDLAVEGAGFSGAGGLPRLPFSRREAEDITNRLPQNLTLKQLDFRATKDSVFTSALDQYRIVHFATHGLMDSRNPALSGLVLSLVDKQGNDLDGFLRLQDIYNLRLNADLVVLSACSTALGKEVRGEGIIGLTRGFMYAGSPRVVASLWKVDDAATAEFMAIFYKKMLVENLRPAAALRAAQSEMMKQPRWRSPYYWAPFVLQGEWK